MSVLVYALASEITTKALTQSHYVASVPYHRFKDRIKAAKLVLQGRGVVVAAEHEAVRMLLERKRNAGPYR